MFTDIIETLLQKKANLAVEKERRMKEALEAVELEFADTSAKIDGMLYMAGYVEPVVEEAPVEEAVEEVVEETVEEAVAAEETIGEHSATEGEGAVNGETFYSL